MTDFWIPFAQSVAHDRQHWPDELEGEAALALCQMVCHPKLRETLDKAAILLSRGILTRVVARYSPRSVGLGYALDFEVDQAQLMNPSVFEFGMMCERTRHESGGDSRFLSSLCRLDWACRSTDELPEREEGLHDPDPGMGSRHQLTPQQEAMRQWVCAQILTTGGQQSCGGLPQLFATRGSCGQRLVGISPALRMLWDATIPALRHARLALTGPPGTGKGEAALAAARRLQHLSPDRSSICAVAVVCAPHLRSQWVAMVTDTDHPIGTPGIAVHDTTTVDAVQHETFDLVIVDYTAGLREHTRAALCVLNKLNNLRHMVFLQHARTPSLSLHAVSELCDMVSFDHAPFRQQLFQRASSHSALCNQITRAFCYSPSQCRPISVEVRETPMGLPAQEYTACLNFARQQKIPDDPDALSGFLCNRLWELRHLTAGVRTGTLMRGTTTTITVPDDAGGHDDDCPICLQPIVQPATMMCRGAHKLCQRCAWQICAVPSATCPMCRGALQAPKFKAAGSAALRRPPTPPPATPSDKLARLLSMLRQVSDGVQAIVFARGLAPALHDRLAEIFGERVATIAHDTSPEDVNRHLTRFRRGAHEVQMLLLDDTALSYGLNCQATLICVLDKGDDHVPYMVKHMLPDGTVRRLFCPGTVDDAKAIPPEIKAKQTMSLHQCLDYLYRDDGGCADSAPSPKRARRDQGV